MFYTAYIPQIKHWVSLQASLPQMKISMNWFNYSVTAVTSPILAEVGQWRGETSDATPENKKEKTQPKKPNITTTTLAEIQVKQFGSRQQGTLRL